MKVVAKTKTWADHWNDIIRFVLFQDDELKKLMMLSEKTTIIQFIDKYFIEDAGPDEIMTNEKVRIAYYDSEGQATANKNVRVRYKEFDIYVKQDVLHTATKDRLQSRAKQIAERIKYLLIKDYHVCNMHFEYEDDYHLWTKTIGYKRYHIVFSYKTTV